MKEGTKYDGEKPRYSLIIPEFLDEFAKILTYGAKKYADDNWKRVTPLKERYLNALYRHLNAYHRGEIIDPDSGLSHIGHITACAMFLFWGDMKEGSE